MSKLSTCNEYQGKFGTYIRTRCTECHKIGDCFEFGIFLNGAETESVHRPVCASCLHAIADSIAEVG